MKEKQNKQPINLYINREEQPKNIKDNINLIKIILAYSARNNKANPPLPYSILKPDTSSDSPSAKSKGVRFVSASKEVNQQRNTGKNKYTSHKEY